MVSRVLLSGMNRIDQINDKDEFVNGPICIYIVL